MSQMIIHQKSFFLVSFVLLSIVTMLLLIGPRVPQSMQKQQCVVDLHIMGPFGVSLNCDSPEFMNDAVHPSNLLKKNSVRQSRPGMILAAYILSKPLFFLNDLANRLHPDVTRKGIASTRINALWQSGFAVYAAYLLMNLAILMLACYFYFKMVQINSGVSLAALSLITVFFVNAITETYLWSPHTQMFNIMEPLFLCWLVYQGFSRSIFDKWWYGITITMSLLVTAYGTFLLYAPLLFLIFLYQYLKLNTQQHTISRYSARLIAHAVIFIIPTLAWYLIVKHVVGTYYVHEAVVYKQFTWMMQAWQQGIGAVAYRLLLNTKTVLLLIVEQNYLLIAMIALLTVGLKKYNFSSWDKNRVSAALLVALLSALFVIFNGFIIPRMVSTVMPVAVFICGYCLECLLTRLTKNKQQQLNVICITTMVVYSIWSLIF